MHNLSALCIIQDNLLREIGDKNPHAEFLQLLFMKCSFNLFGSEHVRCILSHLSDDRYGNRHLEDSSVQLLLVREITLKERILKLVDISRFFSIIIFCAPHTQYSLGTLGSNRSTVLQIMLIIVQKLHSSLFFLSSFSDSQ